MKNLISGLIVALTFSAGQAAEDSKHLLSDPSRAPHNRLTTVEKAEGWELLFDGSTAKGWRGIRKPDFPAKGWVVTNGTLKLEAGSRPGDIITEQTYEQFDLVWEWRIPKGANNGIKYFIIEQRGAIGHEYQMLDDETAKPIAKHATASYYDVLPPSPDKPVRPPGEWNQSRVLVQGNTVEHWLNGTVVLKYELGSPEVLAAVQRSKFKDVSGFGTRVRGHILLTDHNDQVEYRNIKVRRLDSEDTAGK